MTTQARELAGIISNAGDLLFDDDVTLQSDGAILNFGADSEVTVTHVHNTGLLVNSTRQLQFGDSGTYIYQSADGVLNLTSDTEVEINATTIDINGNVDISGNLVLGGNITIGDADSDAITINADLTSHLIPNATGTYDLGTSVKEWRNAYFDGTVTSDAFAGPLTGAVTGNADTATTATTATNVTAAANNSTDETVYPTFVDGATGTQGIETDTGLTYNPSSGLLTITGELDAGSLDISGNADIDGTLEADVITVDGTALNEYIADTVGAMVGSNTESGIAVAYQDGDNTLDFTVATLNQDTTGLAGTATALATARTIAMTGDVVWSSGSFDGSGNVTAAATIQTDAVDIAMLSATGTASSSTFLRGDNAWTAVVSSPITALNNATANELVTVGSTTTELDAEANLTYDGTTLVAGNTAAADSVALQLKNTPSSAATHKTGLEFWSNEGTADASTYRAGYIYSEFDGSNYTDARLTFGNGIGSAFGADVMHIKNGKVGIGATSPGGLLETYNATDNTKHWRIHRPGTAEFGIGVAGSYLHISDSSSMPSGSSKGIYLKFNTGEVGIGVPVPTTYFSIAKSANITQVALTSSSAAVAWDAKAAANAYHVTTENTTFSAPSNAVEGAVISVEIAQGGTARTISWNTVFEFAASTAPTITATASKTDILTFRYNGSVWQEIGRVQNMAQT